MMVQYWTLIGDLGHRILLADGVILVLDIL